MGPIFRRDVFIVRHVESLKEEDFFGHFSLVLGKKFTDTHEPQQGFLRKTAAEYMSPLLFAAVSKNEPLFIIYPACAD